MSRAGANWPTTWQALHEQGRCGCDLGDNRAAVDFYDRAIEIRERLVNVEGRRELADDLATLYMNKAIAVWEPGGQPGSGGFV